MLQAVHGFVRCFLVAILVSLLGLRSARCEIHLQVEKGADRWAETALETVRRAKAGVEGRLGLPVPDDFTLVLVRGTRSFERFVGSETAAYAVAAAMPASNLVIVNIARIDTIPPNTLAESLRHELTHLAVHRAATHSIPLWLDEGVACWTAGRVYLAPLTNLRERAALNTLLPLENLNDSFPSARRDLSLAYLESESFVSFLITRFGLDNLRKLIMQISAKDPDTALQRMYSMDLVSLEEEWKKEITPAFPVLYIAFRRMDIYAWMAVATIVVALIVRWKSARKRRQWEQEESGDWEEWGDGPDSDYGRIRRLQ